MINQTTKEAMLKSVKKLLKEKENQIISAEFEPNKEYFGHKSNFSTLTITFTEK